jgi:F0F1-type ATP synthase delta subunit
MKYSIHIYAKALAAVATAAHGADADRICKNFIELLRRSGDGERLLKVLTAAERIMRAKDGTKRIVVRMARKQKLSARELVAHLMGPHDAAVAEIDPSLIAGVKVIINDEREYDGSLKTKLDRLFGSGVT